MKYIISKKVVLALLFIAVAVCGLIVYLMPKNYILGDNETKNIYLQSVSNPRVSSISDDKIIPDNVYVYFTDSLFRLNLTDDELNTALQVSPPVHGQWKLVGDSGFRFEPAGDWIPDTQYQITIPESVLAENVRLINESIEFHSPNFESTVEKTNFYEAPQDIKSKHAVATFAFSYPLDVNNLQKQIKVYSNSGDSYDFTYNLTDANRRLHVMSSPIKIKEYTDFVNIELSKIANDYNGEKLPNTPKAVVTIPSISNFFKSTQFESSIVHNEQKENRPEQILFAGFSTMVSTEEAAKNVQLYVSSHKYCNDMNKEFANISNDEQLAKLSDLKQIELIPVNGTEKSAKVHTFRFNYVDSNQCLVAVIKKGIRSEEEYALADNYLYLFNAPEYPLESDIAFDGSIIPLRGDKNLPLVSRGVDTLNIKIARINSNNINHLITQTSGDFSNPYFLNRYSFNEDNIAEVFEKKLNVNLQNPADQIYSSLDLGEYFQGKKGIFLVKLTGSLSDQRYSSEDSRLIVITDLGIIVKDNTDNTHDIFVSSITDETPVSDVRVEVLGKNGLPILSARTNDEGYVRLADFSSFRDDKQAVAYKVTDVDDVSYLPINRYDRRMDVSRFDVDGIYDDYQPADVVSAYGFSDRGIYRPNEYAYFGLIIRQKDLQVPERLPLNIEVRNVNGDKVATKNVWPDKYGLIDYSYHIPANAALGEYTLNLRQVRENEQYYYLTAVSFNVQEFTPDTLRLKLSLENAPLKGWYIGKDVKALVDLQNLYGNPAAEHQVTGNYSLMPVSFSFKEYDGYSFRDPLRIEGAGVKSYNEALTNTTTNDKGKADFTIDLNNFEKGTYRLNVMVDGLEANGGRGVSAMQNMLVSPNEYLAGYKADGDLSYIYKGTERKITLIAINNSLEAISLKGLKLGVYQREYVSSLVEMPDRTYRYQMMPQEKLLSRKDFAIADVGTQYELDTVNPGEYYLKLEDEKGQVIAKIDYSITGSGNSSYALDKDASLEIKLNKEEFNVGDNVEMQIKAPYAGYGLITIERDKVYAYKWFRSDMSSTSQKIEIPEDMEGNAYINVSWIRNFEAKEIFISPLSYAVAPFSINKAARRLDIELDVPTTVKPGQELVIGYKSGEEAQIILYGVNTGILQVARYKMPKPLDFFMQKKALRVVTTQILDLILPNIRIIRYLKGVGGDMESEASSMHVNPFARKQDKPVAFWSGIIKADADKKTYTYKVPENFNGEIKVMAVGVSQKQMGQAEKQTAVRGDFAMVPSGPYNVSPGDEFIAGVSVANMIETSQGEVPTEVRLLAGQGLQILDEDIKMLNLAYRQEGLVQFKVRVLDKLGSVPLVFKAQNSKDANESSQISYEIGIRPSNPFVTDLQMGYHDSPLKLKNFVKPMFDEYREQEILVSQSPLVLTQGLLGFLNKFPHFCTEQSVSKIFPAMEVFFNKPELLQDMDVYALYDDVMSKIAGRQTLEGGFKPWSSEWSSVDEFDSLYTLEFLIQAKKHNFYVSPAIYDKAMQYAAGVAGRGVQNAKDSNPAYAAYLLALAGETPTSYLIKIEEELNPTKDKKARASLAAVYLSASYQLLQNQSKARQLLGYYKFGEDDVENARYAYVMAQNFPDDLKEMNKETMKTLLKPLKNANFTTVSSAFSLLALNALGDNGENSKIEFNGRQYDGEGFAKMALSDDVKKLEITSTAPIYYVVSQKGFLKNPVEKAVSQGLDIDKQYLGKDGKPISKFKIGDEITVSLKVRYLDGDYINDIAVIDMIPGSLEIVPNSVTGAIDNFEAREDRALIYMSASSTAKEVSYKAKVVAKGDFVVPAAFAEALYNPMVRANTKAGRIDVSE